MIGDPVKNFSETSVLRKTAFTLIGLIVGIIGCGFAILACVGGCGGRDEWFFWIWEASFIIFSVSLITLGYKKSKWFSALLIISILSFSSVIFLR